MHFYFSIFHGNFGLQFIFPASVFSLFMKLLIDNAVSLATSRQKVSNFNEYFISFLDTVAYQPIEYELSYDL